LQSNSKYSRTVVYAPFSNRIAPCPRARSKAFKTSFFIFLPFEAWSIKNFLNLPPQPGLNGLKKALIFRVYARINTQRIIEERADSIAF
jgi:hypothetical protein